MNAQSPTFFYRLGEASGTTATDSSANALSGTYAASGVTYGATGVTYSADSNNAITFNGTAGDMVSGLAPSSTVITSGVFTISFAINSSTAWPGFGKYVMFSNGTVENGTAAGIQFSYDNNSGANTYCFYYNFRNLCAPATTWNNAGTWDVWTIVVNTPGSSEVMYRNGAVVASSAFNSTISAGTFNMTLGAQTSDPDFTPGIFDEFFLLPSAASATTVSNLYAAENHPTPAPSPSPTPVVFSAPTTVNGGAVSLTKKQAYAINGVEYLPTVLPTSPAGYGSASGDSVGEFDDAGYTTALLSANAWGQTTHRWGSVGETINSTLAATNSATTIAAAGSNTTVTFATSQTGTVGHLYQIGASYYQNNSTTDNSVAIGTCVTCSGTTWTLSNVIDYPNFFPYTTSIETSLASGKTVYDISYATWGPDSESYGYTAFDTYYIHPGDGTGLTSPFSIVTDTGATGSPQALDINAQELPTTLQYPNEPLAKQLTYGVSIVQTGTTWPAAGGNITLSVNTTASYSDDQTVAIGYPGSGQVAVGVIASGANVCTNGSCTGGSSTTVNLTIDNVTYVEGSATSPSSTLAAGTQIAAMQYPFGASGVLDIDVQSQYAYLVANMRMPPSNAVAFPAAWTLQSQSTWNKTLSNSLNRNEWDYGEWPAYDGGGQPQLMNNGNLLYGVDSASGNPYVLPFFVGNYGAGGEFIPSGFTSGGTNFTNSYNQEGALWQSGGSPAFPTSNVTTACCVAATTAVTAGDTGTHNDQSLVGHTGGTDLTQGVADKELILSFQVRSPNDTLISGVTTTAAFTVPASAYASTVSVAVSGTPTSGNWFRGHVYRITDGTHTMNCFLQSVSGNTLLFYPAQSTNTTATTYGVTMSTGATIYGPGGLNATWPEDWYIQYLRMYAPSSNTAS